MRIQELIHKIEVEEGGKIYRVTAIILGLALLAVLYDIREYKNWSHPEAMDAAQVARNLSRGEGFVTKNIQPISMFLMARHDANQNPQVHNRHPDLANPPLYPALLAALLKLVPMEFRILDPNKFEKYDPEFKITLLNQAFFFTSIYLVYLLGRRLFDPNVGWVAAALMGGTNLMWHYSTSGLPTMLLMTLFLLLTHTLVSIDKAVNPEAESPLDRGGATDRNPENDEKILPGPMVEKSGFWFFKMALTAGMLVGLGFLTRYSYAVIALPVLFYFMRHCRSERWILASVFLGSFLLVSTPWMFRNHQVCGFPLGTAGLNLVSGTYAFPGDTLERSLNPNFSSLQPRDFTRKLMVNLSDIVVKDLPALGGNWITAFFLPLLFVQFKARNIQRIRNWLGMSLLIFAVAQALGQGYFHFLDPEINGQKLLVVLAPAVFVFGAAMLSILMDHMEFPFPEFRSYVTLVFGFLLCIPMLIKVLPPRTYPIAFPPYFPPLIQHDAGFMTEDELIMADIPWAVAWYGDRLCVHTTLSVQPDFYTINDYVKPVSGLFLSPLTTDLKLASEMLQEEQTWGNFAMNLLSRTNLPTGFPLTRAPLEGLPHHLFLTDWERWSGLRN